MIGLSRLMMMEQKEQENPTLFSPGKQVVNGVRKLRLANDSNIYLILVGCSEQVLTMLCRHNQRRQERTNTSGLTRV